MLKDCCEVVPIHKKGSFKDPENYRPISVFPMFMKSSGESNSSTIIKVFTGVIKKYQFRYRSNRSTIQQQRCFLMISVELIVVNWQELFLLTLVRLLTLGHSILYLVNFRYMELIIMNFYGLLTTSVWEATIVQLVKLNLLVGLHNFT